MPSSLAVNESGILLFIMLKSDQEVELRAVPLFLNSKSALEAVLRQIHIAPPLGDRLMTIQDSAGKELGYQLKYFRGYYWTSAGDFVW